MSILQSVSLFLIILCAFIAPSISNMTKMPVVVVEILLGITIGPFGLNIVASSEWIKFLSDLGFFILMFLIGLEIDITHFSKKFFILNILSFLINVSIASAVVWFFGLNPLWVLILTAVSAGINITLLKELNILNKKMGMAILYSSILQEIFTIGTISGIEILKRGGYSLSETALISGTTCVIFLSFHILKRLYSKYPRIFSIFFSPGDVFKSTLRLALFTMFLFISIAFYFRLDPAIGAFIAGTVFALIFHNTHTLKEHLDTLGYGFFIPIFFVYTGINVLLSASNLPFIIGMTLLLFATHIGNVLLFKSYNISMKNSLLMSLSVSKGLSIVVLIVSIAKSLSIISEATFSEAILMSLAGEILYSSLFKVGIKRITSKKCLHRHAD